MSAVAHAVEPRSRATAAAWAAAAAGATLLLVRPELAPAGAAAPLALAGVYVGLLAASLAASPEGHRTRAASRRALAVGIGAVVALAVLASPAVPTGLTAWTVPLALGAAVAEEAYFRGLLYGLLRPAGVPLAVGVTALLFALLHVPAYGVAAFPVDLGAGVLFGWQRWASGSWAAPAATHAVANLLAALR